MAAYSEQVEHARSTLFSFLLEAQNTTDESGTLIPSILKSAYELKLFAEEKANVQNWAGHINQCLGASKTRLQGLSLLAILVNQCSADVFRQNCASWVRLLMQILQSHDSLQIIHLTSSTLATILQEAASMAELSRELSTNHIPGMISTLLALKPQLEQCSLQVLSACLSNFPGPCGPFKNRLEGYLLSAIQSSSSHISLVACKCYALLPRVGGGGTGGAKHTEAWGQCCDKLIHAAHQVLEQLYQDVETGSYPTSETMQLSVPPDSEPQRTNCLVQQFEAVSRCLQYLLEEEFPANVKIPLEDILTLCCRALAVTGKMLVHRLSTEMTLLGTSLPALHAATLDVLTALITSCKSHLIPQGQVINKLFIQTLAWTHLEHTPPGKQLPYSTLRHKTYQCLQTWLEVVGAATGLESVLETLLDQLLQDARPQVDITKLTTGTEDSNSNTGSSRKGKKSKQKGQRSGTHNLLAHQRVDIYANSDVCAAALKVLRLLFLRLGMKLKPAVHKEVHEFAVPLLLQIQQLHGSPPIPYCSGACREELYRLLLACVLVPHAKWPAPLHCAVRIFSVGRQDTCIKVASACAEASVICANLVHPKVPSLHSPMNIAVIETKPKEVVQIVGSLQNTVPQMTSVFTDADVGIVQDGLMETGQKKPSEKLKYGHVEDLKADKAEDNSCISRSDEGKEQAKNTLQMQGEGDEDEEDVSSKSDDATQVEGDKEQHEDMEGDQEQDVKEQNGTGTEISRDAMFKQLPPSTSSESGGGDFSKQPTVDKASCTESGGSGGNDPDKKMTSDKELSQRMETKNDAAVKRKRDDNDDEAGSSAGKKKVLPAEEETTDEMSTMLSTFVDSYPDSD